MNVLRKVVRRLFLPPRFERRLVMSVGLDGVLPNLKSVLPIEIEELGADVELLEQTLAVLPEEHRPDVPQRVARGERCWVARLSGEVVHALWVTVGSTYSYTLDRRFPLERTDASLYGAYTVPAYRRRGIDGAILSHVFAVLRARRVGRFVFINDPDNPAAMAACRKMGFQTLGDTGFIELFGVRWYFHRDGGFLPQVRPRNYWRKV